MLFQYNENTSIFVVLSAAYIMAAYFCRDDVWKCLLAFILTEIYCVSPMYAYTVDHAPAFAFIVYAAIYFTAIKSLNTYKVMVACFTMGLFEVLMVGAYNDWLSPQGVNDWLYQNYEFIVASIHAYIVCTLVRWGFVRRFAGDICDALLRHFSGNCLPLYF